MAEKTIIHESPIINVINLSKYVTADINKKVRLLRKLKFSDPPLYARYSSPKSAVNKYLQDNERRIIIFDEYIKKEKERILDSQFKIIDQRCSLECLDILKSKSSLFFTPYNNHFSKKGLKKQFTHIYVHGVDVSLSPDLAIYDNESNKLAGFVKFSFSKDKKGRLTFQQGQLITGLIKDHLEEQFNVTLNRKLCIALDVFAIKPIVAPEESTWLKDRPKLDDAFIEIANLWPDIQGKTA